MQTETLIDTLVADLGPVRPRSQTREAMLLGGLVLVEVALFIWLGNMRPDMPLAVATPAFWWKAGTMAAFGGLAAAATLISLDPATTAARRIAGVWRGLGLALVLALATGWLIDAGQSGQEALLARLAWREGVDCVRNIGLLTLPLALALVILVRRGAPTQLARTSTAAGLAAAAFGAFVFAFHCPHDDPLYVLVWYGGGLAMITGLSRLLLPRLVRW